MSDDFETRIKQLAVGAGLGYVAWGAVKFIYQAPLLAIGAFLAFLGLGWLVGTAFHELLFMLWWFLSMVLLVGIGALFVNGRFILGFLALLVLVTVLGKMADHGVIKYMYSGEWPVYTEVVVQAPAPAPASDDHGRLYAVLGALAACGFWKLCQHLNPPSRY